jgi:dipeptidyl aminopeptidase/acylaminoacyl peptidase
VDDAARRRRRAGDAQARARPIGGTLDDDPDALHWAPDGRGVWFAVGQRGTSNVWWAPADGSGARAVTTGTHMLSLVSVARRGAPVGVGVRSSFREPPDVVRLALRDGRAVPARITSVNDDLLARVALGDVEELTYASSGGARVQGWLVKPPGFDPARRYPLLMEIHGGPHAAYNVGFNAQFQNFAAQGFLVLYVNPRGSTGYGSAFGNAIERRYPGVDYDDLIAGVDATIARGSSTRRACTSAGAAAAACSRAG